MKIKKIAFGNSLEAFIEDRFTDGVNIIYSDDNNRGKTLVMQGLMYSIGNEPIFPSTFNYKDYYFYSEIEIKSTNYEFLRKNNTFILKNKQHIQLFNTHKDFRYYFDQNIFQLPRIIKEGRPRMVDLHLMYEIFFIGQDKRNSSNLISKGQFNKNDFTTMLYSMTGIVDNVETSRSSEELNTKIKLLSSQLKTTKKKIRIIKNNPQIADIVSKTFSTDTFQDKIKQIKDLNNKISSIKRSRKRELNRVSKLELLITELRSLNRDLDEGKIQCGDCGSENIIYKNDEFKFEISNTSVRSNIISSIKTNIYQKKEMIEEYNHDLKFEQSCLQEELKDTPQNFKDIIVYQDSILDNKDLDTEASNISDDISSLKRQLTLLNETSDKSKKKQFDLIEAIISEMTSIYKKLDPKGNLKFNDIFTKNDATFSGSEEQEYYYSRIISLNKVLKHPFPLLIDSFRDGEISTDKEVKMIEKFIDIKKQVILTSTLKKEEYSINKYSSNKSLNALDYSSHQNRAILQPSHLNDFKEIIETFDGVILE